MNIWMINHYAGLPASVPATRTYDLACHLARAGHHVTIVACSFNHYSFAEEQLGPFRLIRRTSADGVQLIWIRGISYRRNGMRRLANMLLYSLIVVGVGITSRERPDLLIGTTVHPFAPVSAYVVSRLRGARFWVDITDIWPESLIELGHITPYSLPARLFARLERFSIRHAERVMSVLPNIGSYVRDLGMDKPTVWTPNGFDAARLPDIGAAVSTGAGFRVMYAGGFAPAHALEVIVEAARLLEARGELGVTFSLIGDGPDFSKIQGMVTALGLTNVDLQGFVPKAKLYQRLATADALIVTGKSLPVYRYGISYNKIPDYMLIGLPIIFALDAGNNAVAEAGAGISVKGEDPLAVADAVVALRRMSGSERQAMGDRARAYARENFDYANIARRMASHF